MVQCLSAAPRLRLVGEPAGEGGRPIQSDCSSVPFSSWASCCSGCCQLGSFAGFPHLLPHPSYLSEMVRTFLEALTKEDNKETKDTCAQDTVNNSAFIFTEYITQRQEVRPWRFRKVWMWTGGAAHHREKAVPAAFKEIWFLIQNQGLLLPLEAPSSGPHLLSPGIGLCSSLLHCFLQALPTPQAPDFPTHHLKLLRIWVLELWLCLAPLSCFVSHLSPVLSSILKCWLAAFSRALRSARLRPSHPCSQLSVLYLICSDY